MISFRTATIAVMLVATPALATGAEPAVPGVMPATALVDSSVPGVAPAASASERRLTPEQIDKVLADAARRNHEIPVGSATVADAAPCPQQPHGEMGVEAGTGGYSAIYGATVIPLGCHAAAAIAFETGRATGGYRHRR